MPDKLAKRTDLKSLLDMTEAALDALLDQLIERATARAEVLAGRLLARREAIEEYPHDPLIQSQFLHLARFPLEAVTSVKQIYWPSEGFDGVDALVEDEEYIVDADNGKLERVGAVWYLRRKCVQVIYSGGYVDPAEDPMPADAVTPPEDLQHGILQQAVMYFRHRDNAGLSGESFGAGGSTNFRALGDHPDLVEACKALRRFMR